jgi:hypothetical protein
MTKGSTRNLYFLFIFLLILAGRFFIKALGLNFIYDRNVNLFSNIIIVIFILLQCKSRSKKVKSLLLFVAFCTIILSLALYFNIFNLANIDAMLLIFILSFVILGMLLLLLFQAISQVIQYYKYK